MMVIIVGGGRTGKGLADRITKTGHEAAVVEIDEERAHELTTDLDGLVVHGNGTDVNVLKDAGIEKSDALVAVTPNDEANLMVCKLANDLGVPRIVARVNKNEHAKMFKDVGTDAMISSVTSTIGLFEKATTGPEIYGLLSLGGEKGDAIEVTVSGDSEAEGKSIKDLDLPKICTVSLITRKGELISPRGDTVFQESDRVILVGESEDVISTSKLFRKNSSQFSKSN